MRDNLTKSQCNQLNLWRKEHLPNNESNFVMRIQDKGNRFVIVDKETDIAKAEAQIARSSFKKLDYDPTAEHIEKVRKWADKWYGMGEISKEWKDFVINVDAKAGINSTLYKTHKEGAPVWLLTSGCNTANENLAKFIKIVCVPLTENLCSRIKNTANLLNIIDRINANGIPDNAMLVSFDIINMYPSIDNANGIKAVKAALDKRASKTPSTSCIIEGLNICLLITTHYLPVITYYKQMEQQKV